MDAPNIVSAAVAILLLYVIVRVLAAVRDGYRQNRRLAQRGATLAFGLPLVTLAPVPFLEAPADDLRLFLLGGALWVTLALALGGFVLSRMQSQQLRGHP